MPKKATEVAPEDEPLAGAWNTEDLDKTRYTAGRLTEEGIVIIPEEMVQMDGKNGPFKVVKGTDADGKASDLVFSSEKLSKIFTAHWDEMKGNRVKVTGHGVGFDRQYHVALVQKKLV
jgi:hypothetical protein